jgi:hypothetical protein
MPNIVPHRYLNYRFYPDAGPKWDTPVPYPDPEVEVYANTFAAEAEDKRQPRIRQFPEPHRWAATSLLEPDGLTKLY